MKTETEQAVGAATWRVLAASVRGTGHVKANLPCQDVLRWQTGPGPWVLAALADGAGSANLAEVGAGVAAQRGLEALNAKVRTSPGPATDEEWRAGLLAALRAARDAVFAEAEQRKVQARDLASTLTLLAVSPTLAVAAQIGDGAALVSAPPAALLCLTKPMLAEYLNETTFLTSETALDAPQVVVRRGPWRHAALLCDGLQLLALRLPEGTPHERFFQPLFRFLESASDLAVAHNELSAFLQSPRLTARADDDLSLLLAACGMGPAPHPLGAAAT
jgi:hypothetical protein